MKIGRLLFVLAAPILIVASGNVAKGQDSKPSTIEGVKKVACHVQSTEGTDMVRGVPHGERALKSDIYVQNGPKTKPRLLVQGGEAPQWSPNGEKIAFLGFSTVSEFNTVVLAVLHPGRFR